MKRGSTIVVSAYLCGSGQEKKVRYFERLDEALRRRGFKLFLVNTGPDPFDTTVDHVTMPYCVTMANRIRGEQYLKEAELSPALREAAGIESAIRNSPLLTAAVKIIFFRRFMRRILGRKRPALCIIWHQFNGLHRGLRDLCEGLRVPVVYAEYGSLPGTVVFEAGGQMAESWVLQRHAEFVELPVDADDVDRAERLLDRVRAEKRSRKGPPTGKSIAEVLSGIRARGRKVIFCAGQNDPQTGMVPCWLPNAGLHSPYYEDTVDCVRHLVELSEANDWHVLFKPHPMLEAKQKSIEVAYPDRLVFVTDADIFECMEQSDLTVTILSQVAYLAMVHGRPCALLGRNQLSGKGCVYEPSDREDVEATLVAALERGLSDEQRTNWVKHVAQLCTYYLFGFEEDITNVIGRDVDECADFLEGEILRAPEAGVAQNGEASATDTAGGRGLLGIYGRGRLYALYSFLKFFDASIRQLPQNEAGKPGRVVKQFVRGILHGA